MHLDQSNNGSSTRFKTADMHMGNDRINIIEPTRRKVRKCHFNAPSMVSRKKQSFSNITPRCVFLVAIDFFNVLI